MYLPIKAYLYSCAVLIRRLKSHTNLCSNSRLKDKGVKVTIKESLITRNRLQISSIEIKVNDEKVTQRILITSFY